MRPSSQALPKKLRTIVIGSVLALAGLAAVVALVVLRAFEFEDPAQPMSADVRASEPLRIPPLLPASREDGVASFELSIGTDTHESFGAARGDHSPLSNLVGEPKGGANAGTLLWTPMDVGGQ